MKSRLLQDPSDVQLMRQLIAALPRPTTVIDFEETIQLRSVFARTQLWIDKGRLIAFAFVDDFHNLRFEIAENGRHSADLQKEIIDWGVRCMININTAGSQENSLDTSFFQENDWQIAMVERNGFTPQPFRTRRYARSLTLPIPAQPFPPAFSWRPVAGEGEIDQLVALHRAAFGTEKMTAERQLIKMRGAGYERPLDLVAVAPNGALAAFCVCGREEDDPTSGYTDPIGTHPNYQKKGLAKALVSVGLRLLQDRGIQTVTFGTSSQNIPMQKLGERLGFVCVSEKQWFSRKVNGFCPR